MSFRAIIPYPSRLATRVVITDFHDDLEAARQAGFSLAETETPDSNRMEICDANDKVHEMWIKPEGKWIEVNLNIRRIYD